MSLIHNGAMRRRIYRLAFGPLAVLFVFGCLSFFWLRSLTVEPFDFDESVYRQMAEEMKRAGGWLSQPLFNGEEYNHKPPLYIFILSIFSFLSDGVSPQVSSASSRSVSIFFSVALALLLHRTWVTLFGLHSDEKSHQHNTDRYRISPTFFLWMSFLPTIASSAILLDPVLVFFLSLYLCSECKRIYRVHLGQSFSWFLFSSSVVAMTGATMTKGLVGLVLPAGSVIIFLSLQQGRGWWEKPRCSLGNVIRLGVRQFLPAWTFALILSAIFYGSLWLNGGKAFVEEFFIKHHFGRATSAFEGHNGSLFYYVPIVVVGAGFTLFWLAYTYAVQAPNRSLMGKEEDDSSEGKGLNEVRLWLWSWCIFCLVFFSLLATKLPNYIWPIWPAFALVAGLAGRESRFCLNNSLRKVLRGFGKWCVCLLPLVFLLLGIALLIWEPLLSRFIKLQAREQAVMASVLQRSSSLSVGFLTAGFSLGFGALLLRFWGELSYRRGRISVLFSGSVAKWLTFFQLAACATLMFVVVPIAEEVMTHSVQQSTFKAKSFLRQGEQLATADLYSPNVVSSYGAPVALGIGGSEWIFLDQRLSVILTPVWNLAACQRNNYHVTPAVGFFRICMRSPPPNFMGTQP